MSSLVNMDLWAFKSTIEMRSPCHLGEHCNRQASVCRLLNAVSPQVTWELGLGSVDRYPTLCGSFPLLTFYFFVFYYCSVPTVTPNEHLISLLTSFIIATSHALCTTACVRWFCQQSWEVVITPYFLGKQLKPFCDHLAIQRLTWALTPMPVFILWFLECEDGFLIHHCHLSCSWRAGSIQWGLSYWIN